MYTCPDCGSIINEGDPYCTYCGTYLKWEKETEEIPHFNALNQLSLSPEHLDCLRDKLVEFMKAKDFDKIDILDHNGEYIITVTRKNRYIRTNDTFYCDIQENFPERIFRDFKKSHNYDRLQINSKFKQLIKFTGYEFLGFTGGYKSDVNFDSDRFELTDEIVLYVHFRIHNAIRRMYQLNLDNMTLSREFSDYD